MADYEHAVFVRVPKTGSTSVKKTLDNRGFKEIPIKRDIKEIDKKFDNEGYWLFGHQDLKEMYKQGYVSEEFFRGSFKFTFVRDPYTRVVSLFHYLRGVKHKCKDLRSFLKEIKKGIDPIGLYNRKGLSQCNPQYHWVFPEMDFVGHMESIDQDFKNICDILNIEFEGQLPKYRNRGVDDYDKYYDEELRSMVNEIYEEDFKRFGYPMKTS